MSDSSTSLGNISVGIGLELSGLVTGMAQAKSLLGGFGALAAGAVAGVADIGISSVKAAGTFQSGLTSLVTGAGELQSNLKMVGSGILNIADNTGATTQQLISAEYLIDSAGQHGTQSLTTLQDAAEGARVGAASLADVANGVTTEMTDYASAHLTAAQATNTLIAAVSLGKVHLGDLSTAMATILPTAAAVHVSLGDVAGAMATMTGEGTNASAAATYLRQLLMALEAPASKGAKALQDIGLTTGQVSTEMQQSLPGALQLIMQHLAETYTVGSPQYVSALKDIAGGSRQMQGILELTGEHLSVFQQNVLGIADAVSKGGNSITGWNLVQDDFNQKLAEAQEEVETLGIKLGTDLLPVVGQLLSAVDPLITDVGDGLSGAMNKLIPLIDEAESAFNDVFVPVQKVTSTFTTLYTTVGPPLLDTFNRATAILKETSQAAAPLTDTFDRATVILKGTGQAFTPLLDTFDRASGVLEETGQAAAPLLDTFDRATALIPQTTQAVNPFLSVMQDLKPVVTDIAGIFATTVQVVEGDVIPAIEDLAGKVEPIITDFVTWDEKTHFIQNTISDVGGFIKTVASDIGNDLVPPVRSLIGNLEEWLTQSNAVHDSLQLLEGAIGVTSAVLGTLIGWVSDFIGGLEKGNPLAIALGVALTTVGLAIAGIKIAEFASGLQNTLTQAGGLGGMLEKWATDTFPNLSKQLGLVGDAEEGIATKASDVEGKVKTSAENMKTDLSSNVGTGASEAESDIGGIATEAATTEGKVKTEAETMSTDLSSNIEAGALASDADITGIDTTAANVETDVATASTGMASSIAGIGLAAITALQLIGRLAQALENVKGQGGISVGDMQNIQKNAGLPNLPGTTILPGASLIPGFASGGTNLPANVPYVAGEKGPELIYPSGVTNVATAAQTSSMLGNGGGGGNQFHFHLEVSGREIGYAVANDAEAADILGAAIIRRTRLRTGVRV